MIVVAKLVYPFKALTNPPKWIKERGQKNMLIVQEKLEYPAPTYQRTAVVRSTT